MNVYRKKSVSHTKKYCVVENKKINVLMFGTRVYMSLE